MHVAGPELVFTFASGQDQFFIELAEALVDELRRLGSRARIAESEYPDPSAGRIPVLLPPHEYVELAGFRPPPELLNRCIGISTEPPTSGFFGLNLELGRELGAVFDINPRSIRQYRSAHIAARHLQFGYHAGWDRFARTSRDIDVLFIGRLTDRRERALARYANAFEPLSVHIQLGDRYRPGWPGRPDVVYGEAKRDLLARSKVLVTMHGEEEPYFDWLGVAEAICAGALVVSEHSSDIAPLCHGEHLITGGLERLGLLCAWAVDAADDRERIRRSAYELMRDRFPCSAAARTLAEAAAELDRRVPGTDGRTTVVFSDFLAARCAKQTRFEFQPDPSPYDLATGRILRSLKAQTITLLSLQRRLDQHEHLSSNGARVERDVTAVVHETTAWSSPPRHVTVIVPVYDDRREVLDALASVERTVVGGWELVVVDDGSSDGSGDVVLAWLRERDGIPARLVRHEVNRGLAAARNTGIAQSAAPMLLMLDADNELRSTAIGRLGDALERHPAAGFAYGILERFTAEGPVGLLSVFPWDPQRLRAANYIDALALIRREVLESIGGYSTDPRLALGWEDYDLWARIAEAGGYGAFVPEIIARYRVRRSSMVSVTNISATDAYAAVADHAPQLMRGVRIPH